MLDVLSLTRPALAEALPGLGLRASRASTVFFNLHRRLHTTFAAMQTLTTSQRLLLENKCRLILPQFRDYHRAGDGTERYVLAFEDGRQAATAWIPQKNSTIMAVSSHADGLARNLRAGEIVSQAYAMMRDHPSETPDSIMFAGCGEPLLNYDSLMSAISIFTDRHGQNFAAKDITVMTAGIPHRIRQFGSECRSNLAIALHAATDTLRMRLMPLSKRYPLKDIIAACKSLPQSRKKPVMFEYTLFNGINDSQADACRLVALLGGLHAMVNLNICPDARKLLRPSRVLAFKDALCEAGIAAFIRNTRDKSIRTACGMLANAGNATLQAPPQMN